MNKISEDMAHFGNGFVDSNKIISEYSSKPIEIINEHSDTPILLKDENNH